jgi:hypothetical protein
MQTTETMTAAIEDDSPTVTVHGQDYTAREARHLAHVLRIAADRVELADEGALDVLAACASIAGLTLADLARDAGVKKASPEEWTKYEARVVAVELGRRARS